MPSKDFTIWFPEPSIEDNTPCQSAEHTLNWLGRSTSAKACECRRFMNEHLSYLTKDDQNRFLNRLGDKWESAFFELLVIRICQELGAVVVAEPVTPAGKKPDMLARFSKTSVYLEATVPEINADANNKAVVRRPLVDYIESKAPKGWWVGISRLPNIGPNDSQQEFKRVVAKMLDVQPPKADDDNQILTEQVSNGLIRLYLTPCHHGDGGLGLGPSITAVDNTKQRIIHAVNSKRKQVRSANAPVLLAIQAAFTSDLEDFDQVLFGSFCDRYDENIEFIETVFEPNGSFNQGEGNPTLAGILAFLTVGFSDVSTPVLYRHPRFTGELPAELLQLEQHIYDRETNQVTLFLVRYPA